MGGNQISASVDSPKWVKSNERRRQEKKGRRAKVGNKNGYWLVYTPEPKYSNFIMQSN